ncbi:mechanosensitive ion channel family protein, partial [bacterium]|nr:mechanosensitive ion channel family protein [bacterium]
KKAKSILGKIAHENVEHLSRGASEQVRQAADRYMIYYRTYTPIVYTSVKESGVCLTMRYLVNPRQRRTSEEKIWETVLDEFSKEDRIELAYPTTRFYEYDKSPEH